MIQPQVPQNINLQSHQSRMAGLNRTKSTILMSVSNMGRV
jgi:hypothetical protein